MNPVVSREEWLEARRALLAEEKALSKQRDALNAKRRALPWVKVEQEYRFTDAAGEVTLGDLFGDRKQLLVYHFMYGEDWKEGCPSCSFWADNYDGIGAHLAARDIAFATVSIAPYETLAGYRERMGWSFRWVSSAGSTFNRDFHVSFTPDEVASKDMFYNFGNNPFPSTEAPGASAFIRDEQGTVFHTYSTYSRGLDMLNGAYHWMDIAPKGRDEDGLPYSMAWLKRHDQY